MRSIRIYAVLAALSALGFSGTAAFSGCEEVEPTVQPQEQSPAEVQLTESQMEDMREVARNNNQFALDLYQRLRNEPGNLFYSPGSISTTLAMALAGARSQTADQMRNVLHFELADERLHPAFAALRSQLLSDKQGMQIRMANRLWGQANYDFLADFLATTRDSYGAELGPVDFQNNAEAARQEINAWVADETNNKITDLIPGGTLDQYTRLVLTNAIYFKAEWQQKFDANSTHDSTFHVSEDEDVTVKFMGQKARFRHGKFDDLACLELPYKDGKCSMWVLLPESVDGLAKLEEHLNADKLEQYFADAELKLVITQMPKFSLSSTFQLSNVLGDMGMADAFDRDAADFSGITTDEKLYITAVMHKAFIDVNEKGTEAAAATGLAFGATSAAVNPTIFRADHPFLYLIRDNETGCILFMGRVVNPAG